ILGFALRNFRGKSGRFQAGQPWVLPHSQHEEVVSGESGHCGDRRGLGWANAWWLCPSPAGLRPAPALLSSSRTLRCCWATGQTQALGTGMAAPRCTGLLLGDTCPPSSCWSPRGLRWMRGTPWASHPCTTPLGKATWRLPAASWTGVPRWMLPAGSERPPYTWLQSEGMALPWGFC
ncbi:uncharacterized protein LOC116463975, partial [Hylobates moloch]|uniref:uncharacterized protein LOC116463975 n=1 Tax=Hylobates moloch TaxID=81572 RepID=UPI002676C136